MKTVLLLVILGFVPSHAAFTHPGLLHTASDFQRMASKIASSSQPWIGSWWKLTPNSYAQTNYTTKQVSWLCRGGCCSPDNSGNLMQDVAAAYMMAIRWKISNNTAYADKVVAIMNAWSYTLTGIGCNTNASSNDYRLLAAIQGYQFANVGEIMRTYSGLNSNDFAQFQKMMRNIFYPINNYDVSQDGLDVYSSWELGSTASIMAIAVLTDNQTMYNEALNNFYYSAGNGAIAQTIYYVHPGYLGQTQESGRDQGHNTLSISLLGVICQQAWNQGTDLYGYANNRFLAASEYVAKGNLNQSSSSYYTVPFAPYLYNSWPFLINDTVYSTNAQGTLRPSWAKIYNHYVNIKGLSAPYTKQMMLVLQSDGGAGNYGTNSGGFDQLGFETLTFGLDPISQGAGPTGLTAYMVNNNVVLSWWGSATASSYTVYRGTTTNGPWTSLSSGITDPLTYTDVGPGSNTYTYIVVDNNSATSNKATLNTNNQALNTYYTFDQSSGSTASDSSGNSNTGNLNGNCIWVAGKTNNGILLWGGYVSLPTNVVSSLSDFTIASWVYLNARSSGVRLFDFGFGPGRWMMLTAQASNGNACFGISVNNMGGEQSVCSSSPLPTGQWVHVVVTLLGKTGTLYVNGNKVGTNTAIWLAPYQLSGTGITAQNYIGKSQYSGDPYLNGTVDDFRIYGGALTSSQVSSLYSSG